MATRRTLTSMFVMAMLVVWAMAELSKPVPEIPSGTGCRLCHDVAKEGPAGLHASFPCELCHLGNPDGTTVLSAHDGMELESGALDIVDRTCGLCHMSDVERVRTSPMATARGLVAVDRWAFGETSRPDGPTTVMDVLSAPEPTPAQDHLRRLCLGCHLNTRKANRDDAIPPSEGSGCSACHTGPKSGVAHSTLGGPVSDKRCFGCHSRSARISLTYQGLAEVSGPWLDTCADTSRLHDGRTVCAIWPDVHHEAGIGCVDCHLHTEVMGDGESHLHQEGAIQISCVACHGPNAATDRWGEVDDSVTSALLHLRIQWRPDGEAVRLGRKGTPVWNVRPEGEAPAPWVEPTWSFGTKSDGRAMSLTPTPKDLEHTLHGHERLSCAACHAAVAPTCPTCHTRFAPDQDQWDFATGDVRPGRWVETSDGVGYGVPGLAVGPDGRIRPSIPGMVGTLDARSAGGTLRDVHLISVLDPHNTVRAGRACTSCHVRRSGDLAVAYPTGVATRSGARALNAAERTRIATVASCLECHEGTELWFDSFNVLVSMLDVVGDPLRLSVCRVADGT